jgi:cytochrome c oxidase subunit 1
MVGGAVMAYMGGMHYWWPKITGRMYPEGWGEIKRLIVFLGFNLTFFPAIFSRIYGMHVVTRLCRSISGP